MRNILLRPIFFTIIMASLMFSGCSQAGEHSMKAQNTATDFTLEKLKGGEISLSDILETKKAVLVFWTTWCPNCRTVVPQVEKLYREDKAGVIGIDVGESRAKVERFIRKFAVSYPVALDTNGRVASLYKVRGVPAIIALDQGGKIIYSGHSLEEMLNNIDF